MRVLIAGGGTGGHVYPALAIAEAFRELDPGTDILFIGAKGKLEMDKVPQAGFRIEGLRIAGVQRRLTWKNLVLPFRILGSLWKSYLVIREFRPDVAIGVGGYASGPSLRVAGWLKIPIMLQEQNSYAGVTNRILAKSAALIFVAWPGMEKAFPGSRIIETGNPIRSQFSGAGIQVEEARQAFGLDPKRRTLLIMGGSLGARALNETMIGHLAWIDAHPDLQVIWQCGASHFETCAAHPVASHPRVAFRPFLDRMDLAYAASDFIVARAGAGTISELCQVGKPIILVPSPYVAEDHQMKNARSLADAGAAIVVANKDAMTDLFKAVDRLMSDATLRKNMSARLRDLARPGAAKEIVKRIVQYLQRPQS